jgi:hypothetical protein
MFRSVLFPDPDGPMIAQYCPREIENETPSSAFTVSPPTL